MSNSRPPYPPEFSAEAVRLYRSSGKSLKVISDELGVSVETLHIWVKRTQIDEGTRPGLTTEEREERVRPGRGLDGRIFPDGRSTN
jgi:transposase